MNSSNKELLAIYEAFPKAFINSNNEMIIYPPKNIYFLLDNVSNELELQCKVLEWCSREASKGYGWQSRKYHREGMCTFFKRDFTQDELDDIYTYLGNGINRLKTIEYIKSGFNREVLKRKENE